MAHQYRVDHYNPESVVEFLDTLGENLALMRTSLEDLRETVSAGNMLLGKKHTIVNVAEVQDKIDGLLADIDVIAQQIV